MQIGVVFPQTEIGEDPGAVRAYAEAAQDLGYDHLLIYEHVLGFEPAGHRGWTGVYTAEHTFHEPFVLLGHLASVVPRLELATAVVVLPQRQTALVAKQAAEVDILCGGRFRLGIGIGRNRLEYEGLGMDFRNRGRRVEEQIALLRRLWQEPVVTFKGSYDRITAGGINPLPMQRPIPIWLGGSAAPALRRAAAIADGYFPQRPLPGGWAATLDKMRTWLAEAGRDPARFGIEARITVASRTPEDWHRQADEWHSLGATHLAVNTMGGSLSAPDAHIERIREAREIFR